MTTARLLVVDPAYLGSDAWTDRGVLHPVDGLDLGDEP